MLETGFDNLITAVLTLVGTAVLLVVLDVKLGLMCLAAFPILVLLVMWFRRESSKTYREVREISALVIVQFVETMTGIKAVQAYRREPRNQQIFEDIAATASSTRRRSSCWPCSCPVWNWSATSPPAWCCSTATGCCTAR